MKAGSFFIISALFTFYIAAAQDISLGIYAINPSQPSRCPLLLKLINTEETYCILEQPIIAAADFVGVSEIYIDEVKKITVFNIQLTEEGAKKINTLTSGFAQIRLAMVLDKQIISVLEPNGKVINGVVKLWQDGSNAEFRRLHQKFVKILNR